MDNMVHMRVLEGWQGGSGGSCGCVNDYDELLECLIESNTLSAVTDNTSAIFTDENGAVLIM